MSNLLTGREVKAEYDSEAEARQAYFSLEGTEVDGIGGIIEVDGPFLIVEGSEFVWMAQWEGSTIEFAESKFRIQEAD